MPLELSQKSNLQNVTLQHADYGLWQRKSVSRATSEKGTATGNDGSKFGSQDRDGQLSGKMSGYPRSGNQKLTDLSGSKSTDFPGFPKPNQKFRERADSWGSACSARCKHKPKLTLENSVNPILAQEHNTRKSETASTLLKLQIEAKKKSIKEYQKQFMQLIHENIKLKEEIESSELYTHKEVKELLQKYKRLRGAMTVVDKQYENQLSVSKEKFQDTKDLTDKEINEFQCQVGALDKRVQQTRHDLKTLNNYKDKEYPEKVQRINKLKKEIDILNEVLQSEMLELENVVVIERKKYREKFEIEKQRITANATEHAISIMDKKLKDMALQNMMMKKETETHKQEAEKLEHSNKILEHRIGEMIADLRENGKKMAFPGVFLGQKKCLPDTEFELDIPRQEWLPI